MKFLFKVLVILVITAGLAVGAVLMLPAEQLGKLVSDQLSKQLGRSVQLGGVSLTLLPAPGVDVDDMTIANADWSDKGPMLTAESALIRVDLAAALSGNILVRALEITSPTVQLEERADGRANWLLGPAAADSAATSETTTSSQSSRSIALDRLAITNASIRLDRPGADPITVRNADLEVAWPDAGGPVTLKGKMTPYSAPITFEALISAPMKAMAGELTELTLDLETTGGSASFKGRGGIAPELAGALTLSLPNTAAFAASFGQTGLDLPKGLGQSATAKGTVILTKDSEAALRDVALSLDNNAMTVSADLSFAGKPRLTANVAAKSLAFDAAGTEAGAAPSAAQTDSWSKERLDASALGLADAVVSFSTQSLALGGLNFGATSAVLTVDNSRAVVAINELNAYEGKIAGQFVANNRSGLSVGGDLTVSNVSLRPLLVETMSVERFSGVGSVTLDFLGVGQSIDAIMRSLSGSMAINAGPGVISGIDLDQLFNGGTGAGGTTVFNTLTANFAVKDGVARNSDLAMAMGRLRAAGEGSINLGARQLDYLFTAKDPQARSGRGFAIPLRIKGSWANPTIRADAGEIIDQNFAEEKKELENKVRDKVNDKLEEKLGVRVEEGQKPEEVIQKKLEEEVGKKIFDLLSR